MSRRALLAVVIAVVCVPSIAGAQLPETNAGSVIVTTGQAMIAVPADRAFLHLAAEGRAQKAAEAQRLAATAMTSLLATLKGTGLPADAVKTIGYTLAPEYDYANGRQAFRDFLARNEVEVRVDDLSTLSAIIDASGASGASVVSGLRLDVKNRSSVEQTALKQAVADAMARATVIAEGANRTLGPIVRIQDLRQTEPSYVNYDAFAGGAAGRAATTTPVEPGEIQIRAQVMLTVAIK